MIPVTKGEACLPIILLLAITPLIPPQAKAADTADVSPGAYDYELGEGFPREDRVKLDYPKSTVLANTNGELLFNITLTTYNYSSGSPQDSITKSLSIYIPPEFTVNNGVASVWTSFTNDYGPASISLSQLDMWDPIAPGWTRLTIQNLIIIQIPPGVQACVIDRQFLSGQPQYVRVFNVTSPPIAGRYFFKVFVSQISSFDPATLSFRSETFSIGSCNFPTLAVKNGLNPAYISGTVRYGGRCHPALFGQPLDATVHPDGTILLPDGYGGRVYARGLTPEGRVVEAQAFFNATAGGRYTIYGLETGTYNITAEAAGYHPQTILEAVTVIRGQSLEDYDIYLLDGKTISGHVYSKHGLTEAPWGYTFNLTYPSHPLNRTIRIDVEDLAENPVASTPLRLVDEKTLTWAPRDLLDHKLSSYPFSLHREVGFDGHIPQDYANYTSGFASGDYYVKAHVLGYIQPRETVVHITNDTCNVDTVIDLQKSSYLYITVHFKNKTGDLVASPSFVGGYLYVEVIDPAGLVAGFNVTYVPPGSASWPIQVRGIDLWNRLLAQSSRQLGWANSRDRGMYPGTYVVNALFVNRTADFIALNALLLSSPQLRTIYPTQTPQLLALFPPQTLELTNRETPVYFQTSQVEATAGGACDSASSLSFEMVKGGAFNLTLYPIDWEKPPVNRFWAHPGSQIRIEIYDSRSSLVDTLSLTQPPATQRSVTVSTYGGIRWEDGTQTFSRAIGLKTGSYLLKVYAHGYLEDPAYSPIVIPVVLGGVSDTRANLIKGASIDLLIIFRTEGLLDPVNNRLPYARPINNIDATPVRIEVFDENGEFKAANRTYAAADSDSLEVQIDGFDSYYGNPRILWTNFYDTTDATAQYNSGLHEGTYQIRVTVEGYYQRELLTAVIDSGARPRYPTISLILSVERLGYLHGQVIWQNWCTAAYPLSWATITAYTSDSQKEAYTFSLDGYYEMWLPQGDYDFGLYHPGFELRYFHAGLHIGWGSVTSLDFMMN